MAKRFFDLYCYHKVDNFMVVTDMFSVKGDVFIKNIYTGSQDSQYLSLLYFSIILQVL